MAEDRHRHNWAQVLKAFGRHGARSCCSALQNSRIFSYRYCCQSCERPGLLICSGSSSALGIHWLSVNRLTSTSALSDNSLTKTLPGEVELNLKCWYFYIPISMVNCELKKLSHLLAETSGSPSCVPTS